MSEVILTDANFQSEVANEHNQPVLIDFWAAWCGPCKIQGPIMEEITKEYAGKIKVGKLDVDANIQTAQQFGILSIPTSMIFKGGQPVWQGVGVQQKAQLEAALNQVLDS